MCQPHTRGNGPPDAANLDAAVHQSAPHTWGWTELLVLAEESPSVSPTHVGMDRRGNGGNGLTQLVSPTHVGMDMGPRALGRRTSEASPTHLGMVPTSAPASR